MLLAILGCQVCCTDKKAISPSSTEGSYEGISGRNVFGLRPVPRPDLHTESIPPPPKIVLTGITTILGNKIALLKVLMPGPKPGDKPHDDFLTLAQGEREGNIEVLDVDEKAGRVRVNDFGTIIELTFENYLPAEAGVPAAPERRL
jgi:hypothetical protein